MNIFLYSVFAVQLTIIVILSTISVIWKTENKTKYYTITSESLNVSVDFGTWILQLLTYWVAYSHMIPISLYVMIEVLKLFLGKLISSDEDLKDPVTL